jgi:hypothetical protein
MNLGLPWLKMLEWDRRGGYKSESWLAILRILKYFCAAATPLTQKYKYVEPEKDVKKWNKKEKELWLKARGIKVPAKALLKEVDEILKEEMEKPTDKQLTVLTQRNFDRSLVTKMTSSYYGFVGTVMSKYTVEDKTSKECEWRVQQFLTNVHELDSVIKEVSGPPDAKEEGLPAWCTTFSFVNLLVFPSAMDKWGPMRNLWEGGVIGEGIIKSLKPLVPRNGGHRFHILLTNFYRDRAIQRYKAGEKKQSKKEYMECEYIEQNCKVYRNSPLEPVRALIDKHAPLCVVRLRKKGQRSKGRFVVLVRLKKNEHDDSHDPSVFPYGVININCARFCGTYIDCPFFDWTIQDYEVTMIDMSTYVLEHSCLLLPSVPIFEVPPSEDGFNSYYTVTSEWLEMMPDGTFGRGEIFCT